VRALSHCPPLFFVLRASEASLSDCAHEGWQLALITLAATYDEYRRSERPSGAEGWPPPSTARAPPSGSAAAAAAEAPPAPHARE